MPFLDRSDPEAWKALNALALGRDKVRAETEGGVRKVIVRAPKLVNVVPA